MLKIKNKIKTLETYRVCVYYNGVSKITKNEIISLRKNFENSINNTTIIEKPQETINPKEYYCIEAIIKTDLENLTKIKYKLEKKNSQYNDTNDEVKWKSSFVNYYYPWKQIPFSDIKSTFE